MCEKNKKKEYGTTKNIQATRVEHKKEMVKGERHEVSLVPVSYIFRYCFDICLNTVHIWPSITRLTCILHIRIFTLIPKPLSRHIVSIALIHFFSIHFAIQLIRRICHIKNTRTIASLIVHKFMIK